MKSSCPHSCTGADADFYALLRSAMPRTLLPANFQHGIWRRIEAAGEESIPGRIRRWMEFALTAVGRPLPAAGMIVFMVAVGLWLGARAADARGEVAYKHSVSPFVESHHSDSRK